MNRPTIYTGAQVLLGDPRDKRVVQTDLEVVDGTITRIDTSLVSPDAEMVDASWAWIVPGFVDTHHHLWQATMRALTGDFTLDDYFWTIRQNHSVLHRASDVANGTFGGAVSLLDAGTTCTVDFSHCIVTPEHADAGVEAFRDSGIRGIWCYGYYNQPMSSPYFTDLLQRLDDSRRVRSQHFASEDTRVRFGIAPTETSRIGLDHIRHEMLMGRELDCLVHPHTNTRWQPGVRSDVETWHEEGLLWEKQLHSHANTSTADDLRLLAEAGCGVSSTPETELGMGIGYLIVRAADRAGIPTGLGCDIQSNNSPDMFSAMRLALQAERGRYQQDLVTSEGTSALKEVALRTEDVLHFATLGGARGLGLGDVCGSIEPGKQADLVFIRHQTPRLTPAIDLVAAIVMHATVADVDTVLVAGEAVKQDGRLQPHLARRAVSGLQESGAWIAEQAAAHGGWNPPK